jgi:mono/diheme cytochrome c family protein
MDREEMTSRSMRLCVTAAVLIAVLPMARSWADSGTLDVPLARKGEYLVTAGNCTSCHSKPGAAPFAGGVKFTTAFGTIYSTNITPDPETGIGRWTEEQFRRAMREGIRPNGEHLYPAFPFTAFTKLTDADVSAMFAYLRSLPAARARAPENQLSFPFNQRWLLGVWKMLFFTDSRLATDTSKSAQWNRGAYLVEALGHCGACHSPRNFLGAERASLALTGGTYFDTIPGGQTRRWSAVNLTPAPAGLGPWSVDDIKAYLKTGLNAYATSFGPMNDVIANSTRHLADADLHAIAAYLKGLSPQEQDAGRNADDDVLWEGEALYSIHCATCHLPTGKGAIETGPSLVGNPVVQAGDAASLINVILFGPELPASPPVQRTRMEPYDGKLSDAEIAALTSFLRSSWGHRSGAVSADRVAEQR